MIPICAVPGTEVAVPGNGTADRPQASPPRLQARLGSGSTMHSIGSRHDLCVVTAIGVRYPR
eukprot:3894528-Rhodomonas_salina.6